MRQIVLPLSAALCLGAALAPAPARAQTVSTVQWLNLLFGMRGVDDGNRMFALELHGVLDLNPRPAPALSRPGWVLRPGGEARANLGFSNGYEFVASVGWLFSDPSRQGTLRPNVGASFNLPTGAGGAIYGLLTFGLWINLDGQEDAWGPPLGAETRIAFGGRFPVTPILSMVTEFNITTVSVGGGEFAPFVGLRLGWAISPPDPKREEALRRREERRLRKLRQAPLTPPPPPPPTP
ncbi:MAG: hypothetical protein P1V51_11275 [Deltaproteobacteria bacterium]|nr:hypothetical protein [Deltaproteobacteria bacterium]